METIIEISGVPYTFVTENGDTRLRLDSQTTASEDTAIETLVIPEIWVITRSNGVPLFALEPVLCDRPFRIMTANQLYGEKIQWFEPLADDYRKILWTNPINSIEGSAAHDAFKHHTWQSIIEFAIIDRGAMMYYAGLPGDWKIQTSGGDGYLLCLVEGEPYWTDGLGQIPFAVDTFRLQWQRTDSADMAIRKTGEVGLAWATGRLEKDQGSQNVYDNFIIIRAALWASKNFIREFSTSEIYGGLRGLSSKQKVDTFYQPTSLLHLKSWITEDSLKKYKAWTP